MKFFKKIVSDKNIQYNPSQNLSELANVFETDKGTADARSLSWGDKFPKHYTLSYTETYEKYMKPFRNTETPVVFFEIGIADKRFRFASPKLWLSYFNNVDLYCCDNFWGNELTDETVNLVTNLGVNFFYGDQGSKEDWDFIEETLTNKVDFIVEDGSHDPYHMVYSLWRSIPLLKSGGYYFMEDIQDPETTAGWYRYDNTEVFYSVTEFGNTGNFSCNLLTQQMCADIEREFEYVEMHVGGVEHAKTLMCVFRKK